MIGWWTDGIENKKSVYIITNYKMYIPVCICIKSETTYKLKPSIDSRTVSFSTKCLLLNYIIFHYSQNYNNGTSLISRYP